ncbi:MAG: hypothetical protein ACRDGD_03435 [Candidatus Limnocylindria bacterium]
MTLAFLTGAIAAGLVAAGLTALVIWIVTLVSGSSDAWSVAPWAISLVGAIMAAATYVAEAFIHRRTMAEKRATGEPWAYRE